VNRQKAGTFILAAYFLVYFCLLVPGHVVICAHGHSSPDAGLEQTQSYSNHHDARSCQICVTGGHQSALWTSFSLQPDLLAVSLIESPYGPGINRLHVDLLSARAPPSLA
jgi:hypothetical protein